MGGDGTGGRDAGTRFLWPPPGQGVVVREPCQHRPLPCPFAAGAEGGAKARRGGGSGGQEEFSFFPLGELNSLQAPGLCPPWRAVRRVPLLL